MVSRVGALAGLWGHVPLAGIVGGFLLMLDPAMASVAMGQGLPLTQVTAGYSHIFMVVVLFKILFILFIVRTWQKRRQKIRLMLAEQEGLREMLAREREMLAHERERSRLLMALSAEWLFLCNANQQVTACSPEFQRAFGFEAIDPASLPLLPLHADDKALLQAQLAQAQRAPQMITQPPACARMRLRTAEGQWHEFELQLVAAGQPQVQSHVTQEFLGVVRPVLA